MKTQKAFSIVELLVATTILLILIGMASNYVGNTKKKTRDSRRINDTLLIAKALDTSAQTRGGIYPGFTGLSSNNIGCADAIDPSKLDLSSFSKNIIPKDPLPIITSGSCDDAQHGYIYHRYSSSTNFASKQSVFYTIEVALENTISPDAKQNFLQPSKTSIGGSDTFGSPVTRYRYVLNGPYCGSNCY